MTRLQEKDAIKLTKPELYKIRIISIHKLVKCNKIREQRPRQDDVNKKMLSLLHVTQMASIA